MRGEGLSGDAGKYGISRQAEFAGKRHWKADDVVTVFCGPSCPEITCIPKAQPRTAAIVLYFTGAAWLFGGFLLFAFGILEIK